MHIDFARWTKSDTDGVIVTVTLTHQRFRARTREGSAVTNTREGVTAISLSTPSTEDSSLCHVFPPSFVERIPPLAPHAQPWLRSANLMPHKNVWDGWDSEVGDHVNPWVCGMQYEVPSASRPYFILTHNG